MPRACKLAQMPAEPYPKIPGHGVKGGVGFRASISPLGNYFHFYSYKTKEDIKTIIFIKVLRGDRLRVERVLVQKGFGFRVRLDIRQVDSWAPTSAQGLTFFWLWRTRTCLWSLSGLSVKGLNRVSIECFGSKAPPWPLCE